jgi:hypothetical protein
MLLGKPIRQTDDRVVDALSRLSVADSEFDRRLSVITKSSKPDVVRKRILRESVILHHQGVNAPISYYEAMFSDLASAAKIRQEISVMSEVGALSVRKSKNDARFRLIYPTSILISVLADFVSTLSDLAIF